MEFSRLSSRFRRVRACQAVGRVGRLVAALLLAALARGAEPARDSVPLAGGGTTPRLWLGNGRLEVAILPELGAKIAVLRDADGRDLLSRSTRPYVRRTPGMAFGASEFDGADEIFPTLGACTWQGRAVPDHGELWCNAWREEPVASGVLALSLASTNLPYVFRRTVSLDRDSLVLDYAVTNRSDAPFPFVYAFHPLFAGEAGCRLDVADDAVVVASWSSRGWLGARGTELRWGAIRDAAGGAFKDAVFTPGSGRYYKFFSAPLAEGRAQVRYAAGRTVTLDWPAQVLPRYAVWCSEGGVDGLHHLGIEPTTGLAETLDAAIAAGEAAVIPPRGERRWTIRVTVHDWP